MNNKSSVITLESSNSIAVGIADPTQTNNGAISVTLNRAATGTISADAGVTVVQLSPQIVLSVNVSGSHGQTFQASFAYSNSILPALNNVSPAGGMFQSTNTLAFNAVSSVGIISNNITVTVNGVMATNLTFTGSTTNWSIGVPLAPNIIYTAVITATDINGYIVTTTRSFDTFSAANYTWEAEDYDFGGGHYIDNLQTNAFAGLGAFTNVDTRQVNFAGTFLYRPAGMDTEINGDTIRPAYNGTGLTDYSIGYFSAGAWANYTRHFPTGNYNVYARLAAGSAATTCTLYRVNGGWGTTNQTTNFLGTFSVPLTAWESYNYIPLKDSFGNLVAVTLSSPTNTLRLARPNTATADCNANFLMLVPIFGASAAQSGTNITISFPSQAGFNYQVQYKNSLYDLTWNPLLDVPGDDTIKSVSDPTVSSTRFYRVQIH